jgi:hypothetical protein
VVDCIARVMEISRRMLGAGRILFREQGYHASGVPEAVGEDPIERTPSLVT